MHAFNDGELIGCAENYRTVLVAESAVFGGNRLFLYRSGRRSAAARLMDGYARREIYFFFVKGPLLFAEAGSK